MAWLENYCTSLGCDLWMRGYSDDRIKVEMRRIIGRYNSICFARLPKQWAPVALRNYK